MPTQDNSFANLPQGEIAAIPPNVVLGDTPFSGTNAIVVGGGLTLEFPSEYDFEKSIQRNNIPPFNSNENRPNSGRDVCGFRTPRLSTGRVVNHN